MAVYKGTRALTGVQPRDHLGVIPVYATFTATVALALNDVIEMVKVPKEAVILDIILTSTDIDTGAAATMSVGDGGSVARYITDSTVGQAGGMVRLTNYAGVGYVYTANDTIDVKITTAPAGGGTGTIGLMVFYSMKK